MITNKSQLQLDIDAIDKSAESAILSFKAAAFALNNSYDELWNLPEQRLLDVLQKMHDDNTLNSVFFQHNSAAAAVNTILGTDVAKITAPKQIVITDDIISFAVEETIVIEPEPEVIVEEPDDEIA